MSKYKPLHVNLSTEPADIIATMAAEMSAVRYQKRKAYGGTRKYEAWKEEQYEKSLHEKHSIISELTEWISQVGNRWVMYSSWEYFTEQESVLPCNAAFIYYETLNSCGAFFPLVDEGCRVVTGAIIFTSHFFERLSERARIPFRSKAMIQEFISCQFMRSTTSRDEDGAEAYLRFRNGFGIGKVRSAKPYVVEVRTFLTEDQLSPAQRKRMKAADCHARIIAKIGPLAGAMTLRFVDNLTYFFTKLAQKWNGFDPKQYTSNELMLEMVNALPPKFFYRGLDHGALTEPLAEAITDDAIDTIIRVADRFGFKGWSKDEVMNGIEDIWKEQK